MALTWIRTHDWDAEDWRDRASCRDTSPELFFPIGTTGLALDQIDAAKQVCDAVPGDHPVPRVRARRPTRSRASGAALTEDERRRRRKGPDVTAVRSPPGLAIPPATATTSQRDGSTARPAASRPGPRTRTDVPLSLCISIEPCSSLVTSACTIDRPSPRDLLQRELVGSPAPLSRTSIVDVTVGRARASPRQASPAEHRRRTHGRPRSA